MSEISPKTEKQLACDGASKLRGMVCLERLCALGYTQIPGVDHQVNFAPMIMDTIFRLALIYLLKIIKVEKIIDVVQYSYCEENIYMKIPKGFREYKRISFKGECAIMEKGAYGLVQTGR